MAERNEKILERVRQELTRNPKLGSRELYASAQADKIDMQDSLQQFHARYVLPIKREKAGAKGSAAPKKAKPGRRRTKRDTAEPVAAAAAAPAAPAAPKARRGRKSAKQDGPERDRIRGLLLQFAQELTDAESRSSLVQVLGRVDQYVSRIVPER